MSRPLAGLALLAALLTPLAGAPAAGESSPPARVRLELSLASPAAAPLRGSLALRPHPAGGEPRFLSVSGEPSVQAELPAGTAWEVSVEIPGYWAPPTRLSVGPAATETVQRLTLWPLGTIIGRVQLADPKERPPQGITVSMVEPLRADGRRVPPAQRLLCPLDAEGIWSCNLPAGKLDLALSAEGFIPQYRWGVEVPAGRGVVLGVVELKRGASLAGWAEIEGGGRIDAGSCRARLVPLVAPGGAASAAERVRSTFAEAAVTPSGFFQFAGVAPGTYGIEVEQPGYATARAQPIEVWPKSETQVRQPFVLRRPLTLEFVLDPPLDWLGKPWHALVLRASELTGGFDGDPAFDGVADLEGRFEIPGQSAGRFQVEVRDDLDNRLHSIPFLEIRGPEDARQEIRIDLITIRGRASLGRDPLPATLWFGGRFGSRSSKMQADEKGLFHGVLPKPGLWQVEVRAEEPAVEARTTVRVRPDRAGRASVDVALPDTRLFGRVVDEQGRPVRGARVTLSTGLTDQSLLAGADGVFELRGVEEGLGYLTARDASQRDEWTCDVVPMTLQDGQAVGPIELRVRQTKAFAGTVVSPLGPVAGAMVEVLPRRPEGFFPSSGRTGLEGGFSVRVPGAAESASVIVSPPGGALQAFEVQLGGGPAELRVGSEEGTLEVSVPYARDELADRLLTIHVFQRGLPLPLPTLQRWTEGHGEAFADPAFSRFRVPALAPGEYRACFVPRPALVEQSRSGWSLPLSTCAEGTLTAGGTLRLELPRK